MRTNSMTKCAVGAMLFGGTLGATQGALAGVTWLGQGLFGPSEQVSANSAYVASIYDGSGGAEFLNVGSAALSATQLNVGDFSASISATTATGFTMSLTGAPDDGSQYIILETTRLLDVTELTSFSLATIRFPGVEDIQYSIQTWNSDLSLTEVYSGVGTTNLNGTLAVGRYSIFVRLYSTAATTGTIATFTVPAPGAIALLGAAGLVGSRRRRG